MADDPPLCSTLGRIVWKQQLGSTRADHVVRVGTDNCGNVTVFGDTAGWLAASNRGGRDIFLAKYHYSGKLIWKRQRGTTSDDTAIAMATNAAGESVMVWANSNNWFLTRHDKYGRLAWERTFAAANNVPAEVAFTKDGTITIIATRGEGPALVSKISDATGNVIWQTDVAMPWTMFGRFIDQRVDASGNVYVYSSFYVNEYNTAIAKVSRNGALLWNQHTNTLPFGSVGPVAMATDNNGNLLLAQSTHCCDLEGTGENVWTSAEIVKITPDGAAVWSRPLGSIKGEVSFDDLARTAIAADGAGNVVSSGSFNGDARVSRHSGATGTMLWDCRFGTPQTDTATDIAADRNGNIFVGGNTNGSLGATQKGGGDAFVVKLRPSATVQPAAAAGCGAP